MHIINNLNIKLKHNNNNNNNKLKNKNIKLTQLNIENSSQAIKIKIKPNTHLISKSSNQEIDLRELSPKKHLSDLGEKMHK